MVGAGFAIFGVAAKYLPIFPEEHEATPAPAEQSAAAQVVVMQDAD
jgi:hypothetical protein